ncbi:MAG TPA: hypothetical protein VJB57_19425 [Dehalococcoidia bacterium]|nr:hypothetical protein [Dehalococcoidia bacterium]
MSFETYAQRIAREWAEINALKIRLRKIVDEAGNARAVVVNKAAGAPAHTALEGTFYWDSTNNKLYVNNDGTTNWTILN